ncbi:MAG: hypothetical protein EAZ85_08920 [Bacteroidetes bacterium]|nr:MAG: hypothetical protein EAZ85_08920 [Bacteroidota bacterium]TAG88549.1 MAG: hypothetical protein EAZ20_08350 [Bacteroidota bacterium]
MNIVKENQNWVIKISEEEHINDSLLLQIKFKLLAEQWYDETKYFSFAKQIENETYFHILAMGKTIVPFIINELENGKNVWFNILKKLTHDNPIKQQNIGKPNLMANDWIEWAKTKNLLW